MLALWEYLWNILIALDHVVNALLGGNGHETVSNRMARWTKRGGWRAQVARPICTVLDYLDAGHCVESVNDDYKAGRDLLD